MDRETLLPASEPQHPASINRRRFARWTLAGAAGLALSACGGGGGGDDGGAESSQSLRSVFEKLTPGLTHEQVLAMVDFAPRENNVGALHWQRGAEGLHVVFNVLQGDTVATATGADWYGGGGRSEHRSLTGV